MNKYLSLANLIVGAFAILAGAYETISGYPEGSLLIPFGLFAVSLWAKS
jgi:hypothetical protein